MSYLIGIDFGSDSVRSIIVEAANGHEIASAVHYYQRWKAQKYCDPSINRFRQHPLDYIEGMEQTIKTCLKKIDFDIASDIVGISVDTTGSTPVAVNQVGIPLALTPGFEENPNAMFVLWKDHTAIQEAEEINELCEKWPTNYVKYEGGIYSSEWFWAKILKISRDDPAVRTAAYTWVEHCDWIPFLLTGAKDIRQLKASRCAAGHKALWHQEWGGLPPNAFFKTLDPLLDGVVERMYQETFTSDQAVGHLCSEWADQLGLSTKVKVGVGAFDAHMGAVGGQIKPYHLSKVMGTSTCDILIVPSKGKEKLVKGICGQVDGSVIPNMLGLEAGQSAFGDIYAWFGKLIEEPMVEAINRSTTINTEVKNQLIQECQDRLLQQLVEAAAKEPIGAGGIVALDWLNGRRTPDADQTLKGVISGLNLGSSSAKVFRSLIEATCYGARSIVDRFVEEGIPIEGIIGLGGVAKKSPFIMQTMANIINRPIKIATSEQTCALGAAMFASVVSGVYTTVEEAMEKMGAGFDAVYEPEPEAVRLYENHFQEYQRLAETMETFIHSKNYSSDES